MTSIATCTLLYAKESPQEPRIKQALDWLVAHNQIYGIYALGFRCQVWQMAPKHAGVVNVAKQDREYLLQAIHKIGQWKDDKQAFRPGMFPYYYWKAKPQDWYDHSVSQYGVLAMWGIEQMNLEVPPWFWQSVDEAWKRHQHPTGGWSYRMENRPPNEGGGLPEDTIPMTAAGVATLYITSDMLHTMRGLTCGGNLPDPNIERGIAWIIQNFDKYKSQHPYYSCYGIERIGVASGNKYFGKVDWYKEIAEYLVRSQKEDGSWGDEQEIHNPRKIPETCFAVMALIRGRAPITMNKLDYTVDTRGDKPKPPSWNERPRDVANITRWIGQQIERDLNWQIVNLQVDAKDLHDAPILWVSGKEALNFTAEQEAKLKQFVEQGGLIVGHADCGAKPFADSFKKLGTKLFALEFRELPETHVIYTNENYKRNQWKKPPGSLLGMSNNCRELMLLIPQADPAKAWQTRAFLNDREPPAQLMANIFLYAVDKKNLRNKGVTYVVDADPNIKPAQTIKVARLEWGGSWDPEPGGWRRFKNVMRNTYKVDINVESVKLGTGKLVPGAYKVAHLTGTTKLRLSEDAQKEIRKFIDGGGTLIVDAAGGSAEFSIGAEEQLAALFPSTKSTVLAADHPAIKAGGKPEDVEYRAFARKTLGNLRTPRLRGIDVKGATRVFISAEDLSVGLVGMPIDGIYGYEPRGATQLMAGMMLYALDPFKAAQTQPASQPASQPARPAP
jgi:hypothetical protein